MPTTQTVPSFMDEVRAKALGLPEKDRVRLAYELLDTVTDDSLDDASLQEFESAWMDEIVRRADEVRDGKVVPISMEQCLENARQTLEQSRQ
jgi:putative addiction module component (TIGR02574 family)